MKTAQLFSLKTSLKSLLAVLVTLIMAACSSAPPPVVVSEPEPIVVPERAAAQPNGAIFQPAAGYAPLFEDRRPRQQGDIITIVLQEEVSATKRSESNASRSSNVGVNLENLPEVLDRLAEYGFDVGSESNFRGQGGSSASNTFSGTITVSVMEVLSNGNLRVRGEKQIAINQGSEYIRFSGVVNPRFISGQNTVISTQVADARIEYIGQGYISDAQRMGWLQRFFNKVAPF